jgi:hypothetical protein
MRLKKEEILIATLVTVISLAVYSYLFGCADRKIVFLYEHLGLTPFDRITTGRYWMAGLILSGFLSILYLVIRLILKLIIKSEIIYWKNIVKFSVIPLIIGVLIITMTFGEPEMTFLIAISSGLALIIGISTGFSVIDDLINDYRSTFIYLVIGLGLVPFLVLFRVLELPGKGILAMNISVFVVVFSTVGGFLWLFISHRIFKNYRPGFINVIKGTLAFGYIGLPVLHYLVLTPKGIPYITSSDNFFADNLGLRILNWILLILIVFLVEKLTFKDLERNWNQ